MTCPLCHVDLERRPHRLSCPRNPDRQDYLDSDDDVSEQERLDSLGTVLVQEEVA